MSERESGRRWGGGLTAARTVVWLALVAVLLATGLPAAPAQTVGATTWYFAEGYTGGDFDEYLTILNPHAAPVDLTIIY
jgi:hypothetical protein